MKKIELNNGESLIKFFEQCSSIHISEFPQLILKSPNRCHTFLNYIHACTESRVDESILVLRLSVLSKRDVVVCCSFHHMLCAHQARSDQRPVPNTCLLSQLTFRLSSMQTPPCTQCPRKMSKVRQLRPTLALRA